MSFNVTTNNILSFLQVKFEVMCEPNKSPDAQVEMDLDKDQVDEQPEIQQPEVQQEPEVQPEVEQQQPEQQQEPEEQAENIDEDILQQAMVIADIESGQAEPVQEENTLVGEKDLGLQEEDKEQQEEAEVCN